MNGKRILITAGPTREPLDPVRFLTNRSSGKMGYALASAAAELGADTTLISGPTNLAPPPNVRVIQIETTAQLSDAVKEEFKKADCLIMAAAPADFTARQQSAHKIKRQGAELNLALKPTADILKEVSGLKKKNQIVVGFALETENGLANAKRKLKDKNLDMIVLNEPGANTGFDTETNAVTILMPDREPVRFPVASKDTISSQILDLLEALL